MLRVVAIQHCGLKQGVQLEPDAQLLAFKVRQWDARLVNCPQVLNL